MPCSGRGLYLHILPRTVHRRYALSLQLRRPAVGHHPRSLHAPGDRQQGGHVIPTFAPDERVLRDPSITQGPDGTFHLVWTTQWYGSRGFGYAHSKDLIHWSKQIEIPVMKDHPTNNVWAPEVFYDDELKEYFIIWSSQIDPKDRTAEDMKGTNSCHRMWYCTTKDWKASCSSALRKIMCL